MVDKVLWENPKQLEQYRGGKTKLQGYFAGQVKNLQVLIWNLLSIFILVNLLIFFLYTKIILHFWGCAGNEIVKR